MKDEVINGDTFKKRFVGLLISQRERTLMAGKNPDKKYGFKSVGEILGSKEYINYTKKKWRM